MNSLIDPRQRHYLGKYYTPDWLAQWICDRAIPDPINARVLDPSCGSGTFLFHAVKRFLTEAEKKGAVVQQALEQCTDHVAGLDVHPVAVLFARVTYLLAIGAERLRARTGELFIPVYLGDAMQWDVRQFLTEEEVEIAVPGEPPLRFPGSVAGDPKLLDAVLRIMWQLADENAAVWSFQSWLNANTQLPTPDRSILAESYDRMRSLHEAGRNHIWTYIVRNLTRPLWLSLKEGKPDILIGNPPWLRYSAMSKDLQDKFRNASKQRGLWVGGKLAPHQDLSAYFFARSVERYLKRNGQIAFVMPAAVLTRGQYEDAMRRTKARLSLPTLSFVPCWQLKEIDKWTEQPSRELREYSPLCVGIEQEVLATGDPVSGSGAAEPLFNRRRGRRKADGEAASRPGTAGPR